MSYAACNVLEEDMTIPVRGRNCCKGRIVEDPMVGESCGDIG